MHSEEDDTRRDGKVRSTGGSMIFRFEVIIAGAPGLFDAWHNNTGFWVRIGKVLFHFQFVRR